MRSGPPGEAIPGYIGWAYNTVHNIVSDHWRRAMLQGMAAHIPLLAYCIIGYMFPKLISSEAPPKGIGYNVKVDVILHVSSSTRALS